MKKFVTWDIFHLSLILSLLRLHPELYGRSPTFETPLDREVYLGPSSAYTQTHFNNRLEGYIHPKNVDRALVRTLFIHDLNRIRPAWTDNPPPNDIIAYIVNGQHSFETSDNNSNENPVNANNETRPEVTSLTENNFSETELTQEDMELIEILWKQDIDLGISRDVFDGTWHQEQVKEKELNITAAKLAEEQASLNNPWHGLQYSIDNETGEHIILPQVSEEALQHTTNEINLDYRGVSENSGTFQEVPTAGLNDITLEEALQLFESDSALTNKTYQNEGNHSDSLLDERQRNLVDQLKDLQELVAQTQINSTWANSLNWLQNSGEDPSSTSNQYHLDVANLNPALSNEDIGTSRMGALYQPQSDAAVAANINSLFGDALLRNSTMPMSIDEPLNQDLGYEDFDFSNEEMDGILSLITNDSDPNPFSLIGAEFNNENGMSLLPGNLTADNDLLSSVMNPESYNLFGMSTMTGDNHSGNVMDASNDSAISCNGSGSANNWPQAGPPNRQNSHSSNEKTGSNSSSNKPCSSMGAAQKKYHFFGKHNEENDSSSESSDSGCSNSTGSACGSPKNFKLEVFSKIKEEPPTNYLEHYKHNHTYHQIETAGPKPIERNKIKEEKEEEEEDDEEEEEKIKEQRCRDEKRAKELKLPLTIKEITGMPIEQFNEKLTKMDLTDEQVALIRDIRRRGKNKVAAQNCRKRKMDQILSLQQRLEDLQRERQKLMTEQVSMNNHREVLQSKYHRLYHFLFDRSNGEPSDPPTFNNSTTLEEQDPPNFPIARNCTGYSRDLDSNKGAKMKIKRKINKNN